LFGRFPPSPHGGAALRHRIPVRFAGSVPRAYIEGVGEASKSAYHANPRQDIPGITIMSELHDHATHSGDAAERWKHDGVRVIPGNQLDPNVPSTPGMDRKAAINFARAGAQKLWAGTVTIKPDAKTGAHHHGHLESIIYVVRGRARMRWGEHLQFTAEAGPGDFIFVPPYVPHQEINASPDQVLECVLVRSDGQAVAINLDIEPVEKPETVLWVDPIHREAADST
jgi:uncharacterized RmlC-like cupin family protein